ncbi:MAG: extracellular solute-binding protein [Clostridia bacterium]|nr:extracellular solute-binding protein [Clostridia bacterium]
MTQAAKSVEVLAVKSKLSAAWRKWLIFFGVVVALVLWFTLSSGTESYENKYSQTPDLEEQLAAFSNRNRYADYLKLHEDAARPTRDVTVDVLSAEAGEGLSVVPEGLRTENGSVALWHVDVPEAGLYRIWLRYLTVASRGVDLERILRINGEVPFDGADQLVFSRLWTDEGEPRRDNQGNDIRPTQVEVFDWQEAYCSDALGYITEPYLFYFEKGDNTISLEAVSEPVILGEMTLAVPTELKTYAEYQQEHAGETDGAPAGFQTAVQGESAVLRSSPSLYPRYDRSSPATDPYSVSAIRLNYIGGDPWRTAGQWIEWAFEVPADGFYNLTVKARQNYARGCISSRSFSLDGETPFAEAQLLEFSYDNSWVYRTLADANGTPFRFWLTAGRHTVRLEATLGAMGGILANLQERTSHLNSIYRKFLVLTSANPDVYRDYKLASVYPEEVAALGVESKALYKLVDQMVAVTGQKNDKAASMQTLAIQLEDFVKDPDKITQMFMNFKDNITALGTAMLSLSEIKLDVDKIIITADGTAPSKEAEGFFPRAAHEVRSLYSSYVVNYDSLGNVYKDTDVLDVWIVTGRDQSTILKAMVDDTFTPKYNIPVNVKLVDPTALLNAVVAGNGPDVVLSTDTWNPINYALRHAIEDLRQFDDLDEVLESFYPSAYAAVCFEGGIYALPETQMCNVLFYRKDILDELGLKVPNTWDELIAMLPTIQGANLSVGIPYPDIVAPNLATYYAMLYQQGGAIYSEDGKRTVITSEAGVKAFEMYTSLYNDYGLPVVFDFLSRFRSGEMVMGIFDYTIFNTLMVSAPEIRGLWDIAVLPGTIRTDEEGNEYLDRHGHSQGACCMMIATDDERVKQDAWTFMKWWVSADSQVRFGREMESLLGSSARYATANRAAIEQLPWSENQLTVIREQMRWAVGYREVAGGYYTNRHMTNAIRKIINEHTDRRETLNDYARTINEEITKKRLEFGLPVD